MSLAPLFAQVLPLAPGPARPTQGDSPSDLAGLFALLLAGTPPPQAVVAQGADPSAPALAGDFQRAVPVAPSAQQLPPVFGVIGPAAETLPLGWLLPDTLAAPVPTAFAPSSAPLAPARPGASLPGPVHVPSADSTLAAPHHPGPADPGHAVTTTAGGVASPALTVAIASAGTVPTGSVPAARPETMSLVLTAGTSAPAGPPDSSLQTGAEPAGPPPVGPRGRPLATAGARTVAAPAPEARRPHASILGPTAGASGPAGDQPAADDQAWLEPGSEAAEGAVSRADHAVSDPARAPAPGRPVPPAPVFQIGVQMAKAVPGRIDRLVVQLEPAALGRVEVRLKFQRNDQVSAVIAAERPDTLDALQRDARLLERSLHQAGVRLDSDGLTFSLKREHAHHQAREESWFPSSVDEGADQPLLPARDLPPPVHWFRGLRALDIRV